jgi:UDP-N-acetylglucosamine/UDP-N-acetyl-alpha-D-glucosaminouronate 4-epimerase
MRYLVTGGAGFIGSHIVHELVRQNHDVVVLDNFSTGKRENLEALDGRIEIVEGTVEDPKTCARAAAGVDYVFHEAALVSVPQSMREPERTHNVNTGGTLNVLRAAADARVKCLVFASTSAVYGRNAPPLDEARAPDPLSPYAATKLAGEQYLRMFSNAYDLPTVALRYFNVFGPRQSADGGYAAVIPKFVEAAVAGRRPVIFGDGTAVRDFVYVGDVVRANLLACQAPNGSGNAFNIGSGWHTTVLELRQLIFDMVGSDVTPELRPPRPGDIHTSIAVVDKAREVLGFSASTSLAEGLRDTVAYFRDRSETSRRASRA